MNEKNWDNNEKIGEYLEKKITDVFLKNKIPTHEEYIRNTKAIFPETYYSEFCRRLLQTKQFAYPSNPQKEYKLLSSIKNEEYKGLVVGDWSEVENLLKAGNSLQDSIIKLLTKFNAGKE